VNRRSCFAISRDSNVDALLCRAGSKMMRERQTAASSSSGEVGPSRSSWSNRGRDGCQWCFTCQCLRTRSRHNGSSPYAPTQNR
jgi:hypothetical protein